MNVPQTGGTAGNYLLSLVIPTYNECGNIEPLVGRLDDRTLVAAGHGRSGFLLAPWTAEAIAAELNGAPLPDAELLEVR